MNKYIIHGGRPLMGEVTISGAKNAAVAIIPAALLVNGTCRIENIPQISDVTLFFSILEELGAKVRVLNQHAIEIDCHAIHSTRPSYDLARRIRASYYLLGALLGRFGQATVAMPGGCNFGVRPIDQHIKGFTTMGAEVSVEGGFIHTAARNGRLVGAPVYLDVVSVGATMNIMMAAALAEGTTTIENAAKEPHIVDLANFLNSMGADIKGAGTDSIKIRGVKRLTGGSYGIIPDQIDAGTYMASLAATGGQLLLKNVISINHKLADQTGNGSGDVFAAPNMQEMKEALRQRREAAQAAQTAAQAAQSQPANFCGQCGAKLENGVCPHCSAPKDSAPTDSTPPQE